MNKTLKITYTALALSTLGLIVPTTIWASLETNEVGVTYVEEATLNLTDEVKLEYVVGQKFDPTGITFNYKNTTVEIDENMEIKYDFSISGNRVVEIIKKEGNRNYRALLPVKVYLVRHLDVKDNSLNRKSDGTLDLSHLKIYAELNEEPKTFDIPNPSLPKVIQLDESQYDLQLVNAGIKGKYTANVTLGNVDTSFPFYDELEFTPDRLLIFSNMTGTSDKLSLFLETSTNGFYYPNNSKDIDTTGAYVYEDSNHSKTIYPFKYHFTGGEWGSSFNSEGVSESLSGGDLNVTINGINFFASGSSWRDAILGKEVEPEQLDTSIPEVDSERILTFTNLNGNGDILKLYVTYNSDNFVFPDGANNIDVKGKYILEHSSGNKEAYPFKYYFLAGWGNNFSSHEDDKRVLDEFINGSTIIEGIDYNGGLKVTINGVSYYATSDMWHTPLLGEEITPDVELSNFIPNQNVNDTLKLREDNNLYLDLKLLYSTDGEHYDATLTPEEINETLSNNVLKINPSGMVDKINASSLSYNSNNELVASFDISNYHSNEYNLGTESYQKIHSSNNLTFTLLVNDSPFDNVNGLIKNIGNENMAIAHNNESYELITRNDEAVQLRINSINDLIRFDHMGVNYNNSSYENELGADFCSVDAVDFAPRFIEEDNKLYLVLVGWTSDGVSCLTDLDLANLSMSFVKWDEADQSYLTVTNISRYSNSNNPNTPTSVLGDPFGGARNFIKIDVTALKDNAPKNTGIRMILEYLGQKVTINGTTDYVTPTANKNVDYTFQGVTYKYHGDFGSRLLEITD